MTQLPDEEWNAIPGARGCTPQACSFRDESAAFAQLGARIFGVSTQDTAYQRLTLFIEDGTIEDVIYPVSPPDRGAADALAKLAALA